MNEGKNLNSKLKLVENKQKGLAANPLEDPNVSSYLKSMFKNIYESRPNMTDFIGLSFDHMPKTIRYEKSTVERNIADVQKEAEKKAKFSAGEKNKNKNTAETRELFEALMVDCLRKWFTGYSTILASAHDRLIIGADAVIKPKGEMKLGFSIDFASATNNDRGLREKMSDQWNSSVLIGHVPTVKYFQDPQNTKDKTYLFAPKIIIGVSQKDVEELVNAYMMPDTIAIAEHSLQYSVIRQMELQAGCAARFIEKKFEEDEKFAFAERQYRYAMKELEEMKREVGWDERKNDLDILEYLDKNVAVQASKKFAAGKSDTPDHFS